VISKVRPTFWRCYRRLSREVQLRARKAYQLFAQTPSHPSLQLKKLRGREDLWSVRVSEQYRAVGVRTGDTVEWIWIGTHNEFDNLFS